MSKGRNSRTEKSSDKHATSEKHLDEEKSPYPTAYVSLKAFHNPEAQKLAQKSRRLATLALRTQNADDYKGAISAMLKERALLVKEVNMYPELLSQVAQEQNISEWGLRSSLCLPHECSSGKADSLHAQTLSAAIAHLNKVRHVHHHVRRKATKHFAKKLLAKRSAKSSGERSAKRSKGHSAKRSVKRRSKGNL